MPVTGKFIGDFSSFTDAVKKANVSLDSLEVNASKVQGALQRMTTQFQGQKLIQDALLATEAVKNIGGATALTESEQRKLNAQLTEAIAKYGALGKSAPADMVALAKATAGTETATNKWISSFTGQVTSMAAGMVSATAVIGGVQAALGGFVNFLGSSIASFAAAEAAEKKMTVALTNLGLAAPGTVDQMNDLAASFQKTTTYSDDLISEMQALLFEVGQVAPHAMQGALQASTDLAAGLGIDLETATQAVAKAFAGNTDALKKYGITVDEATLKSEGMSAVLDEINQRFGGQAAAATETYSGKIKQLANEWDNLKEAVGGFIVQQPATIGLLRDTTNQFAAADVEGSKFLETLRQYRWFPGLAQISSGIDLLNDHYRELNDQAALFKQTAALLPKAPPSITPPAAPGLGDQSGVVAQQLEEQRQLNAAQKAAESAAKQHAETLKKLREDLYGATAIAQAQNYTAVVTDTSRLSAESLAQVNTVVGEGIAAYQRLGQTAPAAMNALYVKTVSLPPVIKGIGTAVVGTQVALKDLQAMPWPITDKLAQLTRGTGEAEKAMVKLGHTVGQEMNRSAAAATAFFDKMRAELARAEAFGREIAQRIIGGIQSGNIGASLGAVFGGNLGSMLGDKLGKAIGSKLGSALGGMLGPIGALLGEKLGGLVDKLFGGLFNRHKGRDLVVEFAESMGGFDALQQKLEALGAAGAGLWEKLTQKVGKNDTAAATAAIAEIEAALAKAGETSDAVTAVTEEQARATIETASEAAKALEDLGPKIQANEDEWRSWGDAVTAQINAIADRIRAMPMPPVLTPGAAATAMTNGTTAPPSGGGGGTAVLNLDGREIARAVVPRIPGVVQRYGLA